MAKFKIGVFGLGRGMAFAKIIRDSFADDAEIYAVCDKKQSAIDGALNELPGCKLSFHSFDELIDCGIDAVILANYFHDHAACAIKAMKCGIAVFSETLPAVTFKECAELCDTVEETGTKYFFAENYPFSASNLEMKRLYETGTLGNIGFAEGEYCHPSPAETIRALDPEPYHWRKYSGAGSYYLTHALAPLMYMTGTLPVEVNARTYSEAGHGESIMRFTDDYVTPMLIQMDSGAVFRVMGCSMLAPHGNWYHIAGTKGSVETVRGRQDDVRLCYNSWTLPEGAETEKVYTPTWEFNAELAEKAGHGGGDFWVVYYFIEYLKGNCDAPFDVYKAAAMSMTAIQAWRSVLNHGNTYPIPDFRDVRQRNAYRNDNLTIFADENGNGATLPCSSRPLDGDYLDRYPKMMEEIFGGKE